MHRDFTETELVSWSTHFKRATTHRCVYRTSFPIRHSGRNNSYRCKRSFCVRFGTYQHSSTSRCPVAPPRIHSTLQRARYIILTRISSRYNVTALAKTNSRKNRVTLSTSFFTRSAHVTPEDTSTPVGRNVRIASATFSGLSPPANSHGTAGG